MGLLCPHALKIREMHSSATTFQNTYNQSQHCIQSYTQFHWIPGFFFKKLVDLLAKMLGRWPVGNGLLSAFARSVHCCFFVRFFTFQFIYIITGDCVFSVLLLI